MTDLREVKCLTVERRKWLSKTAVGGWTRRDCKAILDTLDVAVAALRKAWRNYLNEMREYGTECGFCLQHGLTMQQAADLGIFEDAT